MNKPYSSPSKNSPDRATPVDEIIWRRLGETLHPQNLFSYLKRKVSHLARFYPARLALLVFGSAIALVTFFLMLPISTSHFTSTPFVNALFTATSAVCVTGLSVVPTATYWSPFGQAVIMVAIKIGGLGVMTLAALLGLAVSKRLGLTQRMLTAAERGSRLGDVGNLLKAVLITSFVGEAIVAIVLFARFLAQGESVNSAAWHAVFMGISTFNNAGFDNLPHGLSPYVGDWWFCLPLIIGTMMGSLGFPVILDLAKNKRNHRRWTLHTKLSLTAYFSLLLISFAAFIWFEWGNSATLSKLSLPSKIIASLFHVTLARSTGMATIDPGNWHESTWFFTDVLMFIGGGSAGTAGGIKITTFAVLILAILAEARGDRDIEVFRRRIPPASVRLAVSVAIMGATVVGIAVIALLSITSWHLDAILFEAISAFGTCGLSTGITPILPASAKYVLVALMFIGRTGTMTIAAALALRERRRVIRMTEERPIIG